MMATVPSPARLHPGTHVLGSRPYPWPWDGRLAGASIALVVAGWTTAWRDVCAADVGQHVGERIVRLAAAVTAGGGPVLTVAHAPARTLPAGGALALEHARRVDSVGIDGFFGSALDTRLRAAGVTCVLLAGHGLEGPVHSTLRSANDRGYECLLVADACSCVVPDLRGPALSTVTMSGGIFGAVATTAAVLAALRPLGTSPGARP